MKRLKRKTEEKGVKKQIKSNKGITLIALVITIIVLLILAGVTIAMLTGENGILNRAQSTNATNAYHSADEQVRLAYMAVKTEIMAKKASNGTYTATGDASNLQGIVKNELVKTGSGFEVATPTGNGTKIQIRYSNTALKKDGISAGVPAENGHVNYLIVLSSKDATLEPNVTNSNFGDFQADTSAGGDTSVDPEPETSSVVFKHGTEPVEIPTVGDIVEIGTSETGIERFTVIKKSGEGEKIITAMPYYNLDLTGTDIKQQTSGDTAYSTGQTVSFSTASSPTWNANENIILGETESAITTPIASYESYIKNTLKASNVIARIARRYPTTQAGAPITEAEYIGSSRNPKRAGSFWLGSSHNSDAVAIYYVDEREAVGSGSFNSLPVRGSSCHNYHNIIVQRYFSLML